MATPGGEGTAASAPPGRVTRPPVPLPKRIAWYVASVAGFLAVYLGGVEALLLPLGVEPLPSLARLVAAISVLGLILWVSETLPLHITALLLSFLLIVLAGLEPLPVFAAYFDPVVVLLLGGFVLGVALQKHGLDRYLANALLRRFGSRPSGVLLGVMFLTAGFSMWISNTASTAIMLPIVISILAANGLRLGESTFAKASLLGIAYGATVGGIGTLVGSTPNPLAARFLADAGEPILFAEWMALTIPLMVLVLLVGWQILLRLYPPEVATVSPRVETEPMSRPMMGVMAVFLLTVALWLTTQFHGVPASVVSLVPVLGLYGTRLLEEGDFTRIDWGTLILIGGSIALGDAMVVSGLADAFAQVMETAVAGRPLFLVLLGIGLAAVALTMFASNTAAAVVMIPLVIPLAPVLGVPIRPLVLVVAVGVSLDFMVPVGTPPNAMVYGTGALRVKEMLLAGTPLSLAAVVLMAVLAVLYW